MISHSLSLRIVGILAILSLGLYFALQQAFQNTPTPELVWMGSSDGAVVKYDPVHLEGEFEKLLEQVRRGEAISYEQVSRLKEIKRYLQLLNVTPALLERLNQLIDEILALNDELIYPADGSQRTDRERDPGN